MKTQDQINTLEAAHNATENGLNDLLSYLYSSKFTEDTTVQVQDVINRVREIMGGDEFSDAKTLCENNAAQREVESVHTVDTYGNAEVLTVYCGDVRLTDVIRYKDFGTGEYYWKTRAGFATFSTSHGAALDVYYNWKNKGQAYLDSNA